MSVILYTPEGIPYSTDPAIMAALDLRHRIGFAEGAEHVAYVLSEGFMEEQHEMSPEQEGGYQHAVSDAHDVARGKRDHATNGDQAHSGSDGQPARVCVP